MIDNFQFVPDMLAHRYRVVRVLGEGGFGTTYLAADTQMPSQRLCVVKQLKPLNCDPQVLSIVQERFQREAAILEMLGDKHEQIPRLYANFVEGNHYYLVEEWVEGDTLAQRVQKSGPQSESVVQTLLLQILPVLDCIHQHRIVHRDIKPDNILIRSDNQKPVLIDFGAVKETLQTVIQNNPSSSPQSIVIGTPGFMPAEQMEGYPVFSSDIYSLGLTALYALTGKLPPELESDPRTGSLQWRSTVSHIQPHFAAVLDRAIQRNLDRRFQSASEMIAALQDKTIVNLSPNSDSYPAVGDIPPTLPIASWKYPDPVASPTPVAQSLHRGDSPTPLQSSQPLTSSEKKRNSLTWIWIGLGFGGLIGVVLVNAMDIQITAKRTTSSATPVPPLTSSSPSLPSPSETPLASPSSNPPSSSATPVAPSLNSPTLAPSSNQTVSETDVVIQRQVPKEAWVSMGNAVTGEGLFVNTDSIYPSGDRINFVYRIGDDQLSAQADCSSNQWYVDGYGWYQPQSQATQAMLNYVCQ